MHYDKLTEKQKKLFDKLLAAIEKNEDLTYLLEKEEKRNIKAVLASWNNNGSLLFHAIETKKENSAQSISGYTQGKNFAKEVYSALKRDLIYACRFPEKDQNKQDADSIIKFARKENIFKDMLGKYFNTGVFNELSIIKDNENYKYSPEIVMYAIKKQTKRNDSSILICGIPLAPVMVCLGVLLSTLMLDIGPELLYLEFLFLAGLSAALFIGGIAAFFIGIYSLVEFFCNEPTVKELQEELEKENSQEEGTNGVSPKEQPDTSKQPLSSVEGEIGANGIWKKKDQVKDPVLQH